MSIQKKFGKLIFLMHKKAFSEDNFKIALHCKFNISKFLLYIFFFLLLSQLFRKITNENFYKVNEKKKRKKYYEKK